MKHTIILAILLMANFISFSQEEIEWADDIVITEESFQGTLPNLAEDNVQQSYFSATYDFNFQMVSLQFAFTKNFNKYVTAYYVPAHSWIEEGDLKDQLILLANLDFDLAELFARKFRKKMYEAKSVGSSVDFFSDLHREVNNEFIARTSEIRSRMHSVSDVNAYLKVQNEMVNEEIMELGEFCKLCKPHKKKR